MLLRLWFSYCCLRVFFLDIAFVVYVVVCYLILGYVVFVIVVFGLLFIV